MFLYTFIAVEIFCVIIQGHLLPEESDTDNSEQLNREKRDDFLNTIFRTIPFFNIAPSKSSLKDEDDPNDSDDEEIHPTSLSTSSTTHLLSTTTVKILSTKVVPTSTPVSNVSTNSSSVWISKTPSLQLSSSSVSFTPIIPSIYNTPSLFTLEPTFTIISSSVILKPTSTLRRSSLQTSFTTSVSSRVSVMPVSSGDISPSSVLIKATPISANVEFEPVIKMMIMSAEDPFRNGIGPKLPDETGFGDNLAAPPATGEETEIKNIRYLYANVLIPVMSGIFGALLITLGIILYKCMRRRKLKKVRYYGGKPDTGLYRLDQMSLLSELTSDEDED